jgi:hypothetical protein
MCDTGTSLSIGNKPYHNSYRTKAPPHLVHDYLDAAGEGLNPIIVRSVDADSKDCLEITAIITYYMPYKLNDDSVVWIG